MAHNLRPAGGFRAQHRLPGWGCRLPEEAPRAPEVAGTKGLGALGPLGRPLEISAFAFIYLLLKGLS